MSVRCHPCEVSKRKCSKTTPCERCVSKGIEAQCRPRQQKKRGRPARTTYALSNDNDGAVGQSLDRRVAVLAGMLLRDGTRAIERNPRGLGFALDIRLSPNFFVVEYPEEHGPGSRVVSSRWDGMEHEWRPEGMDYHAVVCSTPDVEHLHLQVYQHLVLEAPPPVPGEPSVHEFTPNFALGVLTPQGRFVPMRVRFAMVRDENGVMRYLYVSLLEQEEPNEEEEEDVSVAQLFALDDHVDLERFFD